MGRNRRQNEKSKRASLKVSYHFSKRDFYCRGLDGKQSSSQLKLSLGLVGALEYLRSLCKSRIEIVKGFVSQEVAEQTNSYKRNFHVKGVAADIRVTSFSLEDAFLMAEQVEEFKGIGLNFDEDYLHVDTRKEKERVCWVIKNKVRLPLTEANRSDYLS